MDNQQKLFDSRISWLAGIWEGEGTFGILFTNIPEGQDGRKVKPTASVVNTDTRIIKEVEQLLEENEISYYKNLDKVVNRPCYRLTIQKYASLLKLISLLLPHMVGEKIERAQFIVKYISNRLKYGKQHSVVTEEDKEILREYIQCRNKLINVKRKEENIKWLFNDRTPGSN